MIETTKNNKQNIKNLMIYTAFCNLAFDRGVFMIYLLYKGMSVTEVALWQGIINLAMFIGEVPTGMIADKIGKKRALFIGNVLIIGYYICMLMSQSFFMFASGAFMFGVGMTFVSGTQEAFLYDFVDERESVGYLGKLSAIASISIGVATFLGGYIQRINWDIVMILCIVANVLALLFLSRLPNIVYKSDKIPLNKLLNELKNDKLVRNLMIIVGLNFGVFSVLYLYMQSILTNNNVSTEYITIIYVIDSILATIVLANITKIQQKIGNKKSIIISIIISCIMYIAMISSDKIAIISGVLIIGVMINYYGTIAIDTFSNAITEDVRATGMSLFNMISAFIMSCMFYTISKLGFTGTLFISIIGVVSTLLVLVVMLKMSSKKGLESEK